MPILVDTSVWVAYFAGVLSRETDHLDLLLGTGWVVTGDLIVTEVLSGFVDAESFATARDALGRFDVHQLGRWDVAVAAAENARRLRTERSSASPADAVDGLIAAYCLRYGLSLLHADPAFEPFEDHLGLQAELPRRLSTAS